MTELGMQVMDLEDYALQQRLAQFLRDQYPSEHARAGKEKRLGRDIGCDVRTAKNLMAGHWPSARHLQGIIRRFGRDVVIAVFEPEIDAAAAELAKEVRRLEEELARLNARHRQVSHDRAGDPPSMARPANRLQKARRRA